MRISIRQNQWGSRLSPFERLVFRLQYGDCERNRPLQFINGSHAPIDNLVGRDHLPDARHDRRVPYAKPPSQKLPTKNKPRRGQGPGLSSKRVELFFEYIDRIRSELKIAPNSQWLLSKIVRKLEKKKPGAGVLRRA